MKKFFAPVALFATLFVVSCGPSAEEKAAAEQKRQDSIQAVEQARQDSIKAVEEAAKMQMRQDSLAKVAADSIAAAEEAAKKPKGSKPKVKPAPEKEQKDASKVGDLKKGTTSDQKINVLKKGGH